MSDHDITHQRPIFYFSQLCISAPQLIKTPKKEISFSQIKKNIDKHSAKFQRFALRLKIMRSQVRNGVLLYIVVLLNRSRRQQSHVRHAILSFISLLGLRVNPRNLFLLVSQDVTGKAKWR